MTPPPPARGSFPLQMCLHSAALLLTWSGLLPWSARDCHPGSEAKEDQTPLLALAAIKLYTSVRLCSPSHLSRGRANAGGDGGARGAAAAVPTSRLRGLIGAGGGGDVLHGGSRPALAGGRLGPGRAPRRGQRRWGGTWGGGRGTRMGLTGPWRG